MAHWFRLFRGEARARLGDFRGALEDFDLAYPANPRDAWSARASFLADLDAFVARRERSAWPRLLRGRLLLEERGPGLLERGLADLSEAVRRLPREGRAHAALGWGLAKKGEPAAGLASLDRALRLDPGLGLAFAWRGRLRLDAGRVEEALADLDRAVALLRGGWAYAWRAEARLRRGDEAGALEDLEEAALRGAKSAEVCCRLGERLRAAGRWSEALAALDLSLKLGRRYDRGPRDAARDATTARALLARCSVLGRLGRRAEQQEARSGALRLLSEARA